MRPAHPPGADDDAADEIHAVPKRVQDGAHIVGMHNYLSKWEQSVNDPQTFWAKEAAERLDWIVPPKTVCRGDFAGGNVAWFPDGMLNVSVNCLDRHPPDHTAIIWEGDEPTEVKRITYGEALAGTCQLANALRARGVRKILLAGILTNVCVFATAVQAVDRFFRVCLVEDAAAAFSPEWHDKAVDLLSGPQCAPGHAAKAVGLYFGEVATVERVAAALEKV